MSSFKRLSFLPSTLAGRLLFSVGSILLVGNVAALYQLHSWESERQERAELEKLQSLAGLFASGIDAQKHDAAVASHSYAGSLTDWETAGEPARGLQQELAYAAQSAGITFPIYLLRLPEETKVAVAADPRSVQDGKLEVTFSSEPVPRWLERQPFRPEMISALLHATPSVSGLYKDGGGQWLAAYHPVQDPSGKTSAILVVKSPAGALLRSIQERFLQQAALLGLLSAGVLAAVGLVTSRIHKAFSGLEGAIQRMSEGDLEAPLKVEGFAEIIKLGRGIEVARRHLARRVKQATDTAEEMKQKLAVTKLQLDPRILERRQRIADKLSQLRTTVLLGVGETHHCTLIDLGYTDVVARVIDDERIDLASGMPVQIQITVGEDQPLVLNAVTCLRLDQGEHIEYRFDLREPLDNRDDLPEGVLELLNTRGATRVRPSNHAPILVDMQEADGAFLVADAAVENLSVTGLAVRVPQSPQIVSTWGTYLRVHLNLPGHLVPIELSVRVRNVNEAMGGTRLGLAFDTSEADFKLKQESVEEYVTERERELRQQSRFSMAS